jgi:hypothetical protein
MRLLQNFFRRKHSRSEKKRLIVFVAIMSLLLVAGIAGAFYFQFSRTEASAAWYESWPYRRKITIKESMIPGSTALTNFPVMITITDSQMSRHIQQNGNDILFTLGDGSTKLAHEIESYNPSTGALVAWVRIPSLSATVDTTLYMYYGNRAATNQQNATAVWDSNYQTVYHMSQTPNDSSPAVLDSTSNARHATSIGSMGSGSVVNGAIGRAYDFDGVNDGLNTNYNATLTNKTISFWFRYDTLGGNGVGRIFDKRQSGAEVLLMYITSASRNIRFIQQMSGGQRQWGAHPGSGIAPGNWYHVVLTHDATTNTPVYVINGVVETVALHASATGSQATNTDNYIIGNRGDQGRAFDGIIDEFRISDTIRSTDWSITEYNNQANFATHVIVGNQERTLNVLSWQFNEATGTTANDSAGTNSGTISGAIWRNSDWCFSGSCLFFDGQNDSVSRAYSNDIELDPGTGSFAVSTRFRHSNTAPSSNQFLLGRYKDAGYVVYMNTSGNMCFAIDDDSTWTPDDVACSTESYLDSQWHSLTAVKNGTTSIQLYVDGKLVAQDTSLAATGSLSGASPAFTVGTAESSGGSSGTYTYQIANTAHDGNQWNIWYDTDFYVGNWDGINETGIWHFPNVTIPQGATITSSSIAMYARSASGTPSDLRLEYSGQAIDSASVPGSGNLPRSMTKTTARVNYDPAAWVTGQTYTSPSLNTVFQELVNRPGWASGNNMNLIFEPRSGSATQTDIELGDVTLGNPSTVTINWTQSATNFSSWHGFIDEVSIRSDALNAAQVQTEHRSILSGNAARGAGVAVAKNTGYDVLTNGLIGFWQFEEASANTCAGGVNDSCDTSGNSYDGAWLGNATTTTEGRFGRAVVFDGTDDGIDLSSNFNFNSPDGFTIAAWVNTNSASTRQTIYNNGHGVVLRLNNTGRFAAAIRSSTPSLAWYEITTTSGISANTWYHVMVTYKKGGVARVYVNGREAATSGSNLLTYSHTGVVDDYIGRQSPELEATQFSWNGEIDAVRIYNRELSSADAAALFNHANAPIAYYNFDENGGTSVVDRSGNGFSGTIYNSAPYTNGRYGSGMRLNGTNQHIRITTQTGMNTNSGSVMAWVRPSSNPSYDQMVVMGNRDSNRIFLYRIANNGNLGLRLGTLVTTDTGVNIPVNTWSHIALTYNGGSYQMYMNGRQVSSGSYTGLTSLNGFSAIGAYDDGFSNINSYFPGVIDEVKMYNYVRNAQQIAEDFNANHPAPGSPISSAIGHWRFDEGQGTVANNAGAGGSALNGTLQGMSSPATNASGWTGNGKFNKALQFDGSDRVVISDTNTLDLTEHTLSAWVYFRSWNAASMANSIISKFDDTSAQRSYLLYTSATGELLYQTSSSGNSTGAVTLSSGITLQLNTWYHLAATYDGSTMRVYVNGRPSSVTATQTGIFNGTAAFCIGCRYGGGTPVGHSTANIDEVKVYSYALSDTQIQSEFNQGASTVMGSTSTESNGITVGNAEAREFCVPGDTSTCNPPIAEWKMDENTGTSIRDTSGNENTGTVTSGTWTRGRIGSALQFNGSSGFANAGSASILDNLDNKTISAWIYLNTYGETGYGRIIDKGTGTSGQAGWSLFVCGTVSLCNTNSLAFFQNWSTGDQRGWWSTPANSIPTGQWVHVSASYNRTSTSNDPVLYINGVRQTVTETQIPAGTVSADDAYNIYIGNREQDDRTFDGRIDMVRLYNYIRTPAQINWDYSRGRPLSWIKFDECTGTTANDSGSLMNAGTISIGASGTQTGAGTCTSGSAADAWNNGASGKFSSALNFDGTDDVVTLPANTRYDLSATTGGSAFLWVRKNSICDSANSNNNEIFLNLWGSSHTGNTWWIGCLGHNQSPANALTFRHNGVVFSYTPLTFPNSSWQHIGFVYTGTEIRYYVNGIQVGTNAFTGNVTSTSPVCIGNYNSGCTDSYSFNGTIDDVRLYNYPLTDTQVKVMMNEGAAIRFGP